MNIPIDPNRRREQGALERQYQGGTQHEIYTAEQIAEQAAVAERAMAELRKSRKP